MYSKSDVFYIILFESEIDISLKITLQIVGWEDIETENIRTGSRADP